MGRLRSLYRIFFLILFLLIMNVASPLASQAANLNVTWTPTSNNQDGFHIDRLVGGLLDTTIAVGVVTSYTDSGLVTGLTYCYRVAAFNSAGDSATSTQACAMAQDAVVNAATANVTLSVSPTTVAPKGTVTATWSGIAAPSTTDWIGLYVPGAADINGIDWIYASCSQIAGSSRAAGSCSYALPATLASGNYELRLFSNGSYTRLATSKAFAVSNPVTQPSVPLAQVTLSASPTTVAPKGTITATWNGIPSPTGGEWIALFPATASDAGFIDWISTSCSKTAGSARASGSCSYVLPSTVTAGNYNLRLFSSTDIKLATSSTFAVSTAVTQSSVPVTLSASPTTVAPKGTITATWNGIPSPTGGEWIALFPATATDAGFIDWISMACSKTDGTARASGSCSYILPSTVPAGNYNLRLFSSADMKIATSSTFAVSGSGGVGGSNVGLPQVAGNWIDYNVTLRLQSTSQNSIGVMFRYQDNNNYYRFLWNRKSKFRQLEKVQNGLVTVLAKDSVAYTAGQTYGLEIVAQGPALKVLIDGSQIFSVMDSTFPDGTIGLYSSSNPGSIFDDVTVKDLATGATLLSANFNDGSLASWTIVDLSTSTGSSAWSATGGALLQTTNKETFALYTKRNWTDYSLILNMQSLDHDSIGVMFRYQDNNNYYRFSWNAGDKLRRLEKMEKGVVTTLAKDSVAYVTGRTYETEIVAQGSTLQVWVDGASIFSVMDSSFSGGTIALYSWSNAGSVFNNLLVENLATGTVLLQDDFNAGTLAGWTIVDDKGTQGSSSWSAQSGSLVQSSNIGSTGGKMLGTFALY